MNFMSLLGSGPLIALIGHIVTGGIVFALSKGYITPDALAGVTAIGGLILNAAASAGRSTNAAAVKKAAASDLEVVPKANPSAPTVWGKAP